MDSNYHHASKAVNRIKSLYPNVNENETPLPRSWSSKDKCTSIGLTQNNLRVHYKGIYLLLYFMNYFPGSGKSHNDAASVRTSHPIPAACGLYYFEVKIISKGRDGYMGIGLTSSSFKMNRLPGWDKQSYGYHGDDGHSFSSSGNGQPYGPTFTTGDIIGCGVNLVDNTCFYTKNGHHLGIAFKDLPAQLYPTVGLQTPGEVVDANFGQEPFKFDIEDMMNDLRASTRASILDFPLPQDQGDWTATLHKMVSSYLVHHGYSSTAETFAKSTQQNLCEEIASVKNRQKIINLVMSGRMGLAIEQTLRLYPGLLENNQNLLFMLKCRQFIEMVNGSDFEARHSNNGTTRNSPVQTSVIQSTKTYTNCTQHNNALITDSTYCDNQELNKARLNNSNYTTSNITEPNRNTDIQLNNQINTAINTSDYINDVEMENGHISNGNGHKNGLSECKTHLIDVDEDMDIDETACKKGSSKSGVERMLEFGRELFQLSQRLEQDSGINETNQKMLEDAFSLLAYSNPWSSPLGWQLCASRRETICAALNSAILESMSYSWRPPIEICLAHACQLLQLMASTSLGSCAFATIEDILQSQ
ncbi:Ran-binding protein 9 [Pseudolycoriella hygida]|uniref:Ran-binding protein 9 n=1 Tax=Pseudolycoriella hygida TaxID=35572 RepID=A0A9Q0MQG8_9DIPT|nr:Ran-binding protein 9 [Pseudolycoriella hygida]